MTKLRNSDCDKTFKKLNLWGEKKKIKKIMPKPKIDIIRTT